MKVFLDMDGVLADFLGGLEQFYGPPKMPVTTWECWENYGCTSSKDLMAPIHEMGSTFWSCLNAFPWSQELWNATPNPYVLTSTGKNWGATDGKRQWLERHGMDVKRRMITCDQKWLLAAPDRILVDDSEENCDKWEKNGGVIIRWPTPYNPSPFASTTEAMQALREAYHGKIFIY